MIKSVTATNFIGESIKINLSEEFPDHGIIIVGMNGISSPTANINTTELASMDGSMFNSSKAQQRNITLQFMYTFAPTIEDSRQRTYRYFPIKKEVEVEIETDNRILVTKGYVETNEPDIFSEQETSQISIICPDPFFYSRKEAHTIFSGVEPMFEFEFSNESLTEKLLIMGEILNQTERTVIYEGDADVGMTITIHALGEVGNISIYNVRTREVIVIDNDKIEALTGERFDQSDDIIICTERGNKSATLLRGGHYINILNCLDRNSDWLRLTKGDNILAYVTDYGSENLQFMISNKLAYEGV